MDDLTDALVETGATLAFDAIGGGKLAGQILTCMEAAVNKTAKVYSRYGSSVHKQVYIYGSLDPRPIELEPRLRHGLGRRRLAAVSVPDEDRRGRWRSSLRQRVVAELKTTFASHYTKVVSLQEALQPANIAVYAKRATGEKFLINPNKDGMTFAIHQGAHAMREPRDAQLRLAGQSGMVLRAPHRNSGFDACSLVAGMRETLP